MYIYIYIYIYNIYIYMLDRFASIYGWNDLKYFTKHVCVSYGSMLCLSKLAIDSGGYVYEQSNHEIRG